MTKASDVLTKRMIKVLQNQYKNKYLKAINEEVQKHRDGQPQNRNLLFIQDPEDIKVWYCLMFGLEGDAQEFVGAEYLIKLYAQDGYPSSPPKFQFLTPNGVYKAHSEPCVELGHYHSYDYPSTLGILGFAKNLVMGLIAWRDNGGGVNIIKTDVKEKKKISTDSVLYNQTKNRDIMLAFKQHVEQFNLQEIVGEIKSLQIDDPSVPAAELAAATLDS